MIPDRLSHLEIMALENITLHLGWFFVGTFFAGNTEIFLRSLVWKENELPWAELEIQLQRRLISLVMSSNETEFNRFCAKIFINFLEVCQAIRGYPRPGRVSQSPSCRSRAPRPRSRPAIVHPQSPCVPTQCQLWPKIDNHSKVSISLRPLLHQPTVHRYVSLRKVWNEPFFSQSTFRIRLSLVSIKSQTESKPITFDFRPRITFDSLHMTAITMAGSTAVTLDFH